MTKLQRLAKLLGFTAADRTHPRRFRALCRSLEKQHPLRWAFLEYGDSRNDAGVVDAFLRINGYRLTCSSDEAYAFLIGLFETNRFRFEELEPWLRTVATR